MRLTDFLLLLIAALLATGIGVFIWQGRKREAETEMMRSALYAIASRRYALHEVDPIPVEFSLSTKKALERFQRTAIDIQGFIELASRYLVSQMPSSVVEDMGIPEHWTSRP